LLPQLNELGSVEPIYMWPQARQLFGGLSRTTVWRMVRAGALPKPIHLSPGRIGWRHSDIANWQAERSGPDNASLLAKYGV
jgi:predicted DNA-binding transcriptional regulator AlpA